MCGQWHGSCICFEFRLHTDSGKQRNGTTSNNSGKTSTAETTRRYVSRQKECRASIEALNRIYFILRQPFSIFHFWFIWISPSNTQTHTHINTCIHCITISTNLHDFHSIPYTMHTTCQRKKSVDFNFICVGSFAFEFPYKFRLRLFASVCLPACLPGLAPTALATFFLSIILHISIVIVLFGSLAVDSSSSFSFVSILIVSPFIFSLFAYRKT